MTKLECGLLNSNYADGHFQQKIHSKQLSMHAHTEAYILALYTLLRFTWNIFPQNVHFQLFNDQFRSHAAL